MPTLCRRLLTTKISLIALLLTVSLLGVINPGVGRAQEPPAAAAAAAPSPAASVTLDPVAATEAYLAKVPADARARSDAYFEGTYWLKLWNWLLAAGVALLLLATRLSAKMRDRAERLTRFRPLQTALYWCQYLLVTTLLGFPLAAYEGWFREHQYGMSNQTFAAWLGDAGKELFVGLIFGSLAVMALYAVLRRATRTWWLWGTLTMTALIFIQILIFPVFIAPLFNKYTPLTDAKLRDPILGLARANGIPAEDVYVFDASRQTKRISANVSGLLGTTRISLNDNLLNRCSQPEIEGVMAHEMGHYVLHHSAILITGFSLFILAGFVFLKISYGWFVARYGPRWGLRGPVADLAGLPLLSALLATFFLVLTPLTNTLGRTCEAEADLFGINASRQPDGFAEVFLKLGEYRKLAPGPVEEFIFYDHPSGRSRILMAMRWKAAQKP